MHNFIFITGNDNKARELGEILGTHIKREKLELEEIQTLDMHQIVEYKLKKAYQILKHPVLVEDVGLVFHAFGNLPGPFIKFFNHEIGIENYPKLLSPFANKNITAICVYGLYDGKEMHFFEGTSKGTIAPEAKGENGFGFDVIFIPEGETRTMAEMSAEEKHKISHRGRALAKLKEFLDKN